MHSDCGARYRNLLTGARFRSEPPLPRGGILADDMGLGKTITTVATILSGPKGKTLVVCPLSVMQTWQAELRAVAPQLSVWVYHGPDRSPGQNFAPPAPATHQQRRGRIEGDRKRRSEIIIWG